MILFSAKSFVKKNNRKLHTAGVLEQETYSKGHSGGLELKILFLTECMQVFSEDYI